MDNFYELSEDTIEEFFDVFNNKTFPVKIDIQFIGCSKQKQLIKVSKLTDDIAFVLKKDLKVTINETLMDSFDDEARMILIEQEIEKINMNLETGKIKMVPTELNTFPSIVNKYGVDKVSRANMVESIFIEQKADAKKDEDFIV